MTILLELIGSALAIVISVFALKNLSKAFLINLSKMMFFLNTVAICGAISVILYGWYFHKFHWGVSLAIFFVLLGIVNSFAHDIDHPIIGKIIHIVYGIADGLGIAYLITKYLLKMDFSIYNNKVMLTYAISVLTMIILSHFEKKSSNYYVE